MKPMVDVKKALYILMFYVKTIYSNELSGSTRQ